MLKTFSTFVVAVQTVALKKMFDGRFEPTEVHIRDNKYFPQDQFQIPCLMEVSTKLHMIRCARR